MNCKKCKNKNCEYRNKGIENYTIVCSEGCPKEIREEATKIINSEYFINLKNQVEAMNSNSKTTKLFNKRLLEIIQIATNPLI